MRQEREVTGSYFLPHTWCCVSYPKHITATGGPCLCPHPCPHRQLCHGDQEVTNTTTMCPFHPLPLLPLCKHTKLPVTAHAKFVNRVF